MYPNSYYAATANPLPEQPSLGAQSIRADVCVIGAGFTGLSTALHLAQARLECSRSSKPNVSAGVRRDATADSFTADSARTWIGWKHASESWRRDGYGSLEKLPSTWSNA